MPKKMLESYDIIVIGSGIAGLTTALSIDADKKILVLTKDSEKNNNTNMAQGGIAVTFDPNKYESHVQDTLKTGHYYNEENRLRMMIQEGGQAINTLIQWGVHFDRDKNHHLLFTKEGGHSERRIIHYKDTTGQEIIKGLLNTLKSRSNIDLYNHVFVKDLLTDDKKAIGIEVLVDDKLKHILSPYIVVATGGIGEIYKNTTNADIATGDGIAMVHRCGGLIKDMEFVQFHPTALNVPGHGHFLISEAVRGEGGILRNAQGQAFMSNYDPLKDLAPRSIVSKAIFEESKKQGNNNIYLDVTHLGEDYIKERFPNIYKECLKKGINILNEWIPIIPVQHYIMGGIETDEDGKTNIEGLYACGEVACTGVHGANRMASNSLLEAAVFARRVAKSINESNLQVKSNDSYKTVNVLKCDEAIINKYKNDLQEIMAESAFIFRNFKSLETARHKINALINKLPDTMVSQSYYELKNMLFVSMLIITSALSRKESLGSHIIEGEDQC